MHLGLPLKFRPILKEKVWGGDRLRELAGKALPTDSRIGESWEISDHADDVSVVAEGPLAEISLRQLLATHPQEILGRVAPEKNGRFPLLVKLIDAHDMLSVQVHPDDIYASRNGTSDPGKTEGWHILRAEPGAWIIKGLKPGVTPELLRERLGAQRVEECLYRGFVSKGDTLFCPPGTVHAMGPGIVLLEVQQNSDLTYRLYDWGRPRPVQVEQSLAMINFGPQPAFKESPVPLPQRPCPAERLLTCDKFVMELWMIERETGVRREDYSFDVFHVVEGAGEISSSDGSVLLRCGETALIPASCKVYMISPEGPLRLIRITGPVG